MDTNPYKPPGSTILTPDGKPKNSVWWKAYFWIAALFMILSVPGLIVSKNFTLFDYVDLAMSVIAVVGLYGFAYYKRIGDVVFWRYFFYVSLVETVVFTFVLPIMGTPRYGETTINFVYPFEIAAALFLLLALYRYAYRSAFVWKPA